MPPGVCRFFKARYKTHGFFIRAAAELGIRREIPAGRRVPRLIPDFASVLIIEVYTADAAGFAVWHTGNRLRYRGFYAACAAAGSAFHGGYSNIKSGCDQLRSGNFQFGYNDIITQPLLTVQQQRSYPGIIGKRLRRLRFFLITPWPLSCCTLHRCI